MMIVIALAVAVTPTSIVVSDPMEPYALTCSVVRPNGERFAVAAAISGNRIADRLTTVTGSSDKLAYGKRLPVRLEMQNSTIDKEIFHVERGKVRYAYIIDRTLLFEEGYVGLTVVGANIEAEKPIALSAIGFCKLETAPDQGLSQ